MQAKTIQEQAMLLAKQGISAASSGDYQSANTHFSRSLQHFAYLLRNASSLSTTHQVASYNTAIKILQRKISDLLPHLSSESSSSPHSIAQSPPPDSKKSYILTFFPNIFTSPIPEITSSSVIGLHSVKEVFESCFFSPENIKSIPEAARKYKTLLIHGPPGVGKTMLVHAFGNTFKGTFLTIHVSDLISRYLCDDNHNLRVLFHYARENSPCIVFFDEIEMICPNTESEVNVRRLMTEFLVRVSEHSENDPIIIAATNAPWKICAPVRRRFEKIVYAGLPTADDRKIIFEIYGAKAGCSLSSEVLKELSEKSEGFTVADILQVIRSVAMASVKDCQQARYFKPVLTETGKKFTPCSETDPEALQLDLSTIPTDSLLLPELTPAHFSTILLNSQPSCPDILPYTNFQHEFS
jgi:vacuolar protein-sorting-associated protein 4